MSDDQSTNQSKNDDGAHDRQDPAGITPATGGDREPSVSDHDAKGRPVTRPFGLPDDERLNRANPGAVEDTGDDANIDDQSVESND